MNAARTILPPPLPPACPRCDGSGVDPRSLPRIPASAFSPAEGGLHCAACGGSGDAPPPCEEPGCGEPSEFHGRDGSHFCRYCAELRALDAERALQSIRGLFVRRPRIAKALVEQAAQLLVANDRDGAS